MTAGAASLLHLRRSGRDDGPAVVYLHGAGVSGTAFQTVAEGLPELRNVRVDLPEHGLSTGAGEFSIPRAAEALREVLLPFGGRVMVVGHSLGGQVAVEAVARWPELADRLVLLGVIVDGWPAVRVLGAVDAVLPHRPVRLPFHEAALRVAELLVHVPPAERATWAEDLHHIRLDAFSRAVVDSLSYRPPPGITRYGGEALVVVGARDYEVVRRSARHLGRSLLRARLVEVRAAPHTWHLERPTLLVDTVRAFLRGEELPPEMEPFT